MLDINEINWAISQLEQEESSFPAYNKLASLYTIRDKMQGTERPELPYESSGYSQASTPAIEIQSLGQYGNSEFLQSIAGKDVAAVFGVIDSLMEDLQVVNPRVYNNVLRKIGRI